MLVTQPGVHKYPSLSSSDLMAILKRDLGYAVVKQKGSHRKMRSEGRNPILFSFHDGVEIPSRLVKKILTVDVGIEEEEAQRLLGMKG